MRFIVRGLWVFSLACMVGMSYAQNANPGNDFVYDSQTLMTINLTMSDSDKALLLDHDNRWSQDYLKVTINLKSKHLDTTLTGGGIRLRGNTSRNHPKRSFKIKFKEYDGSKFLGYKKFNLKAENNDPSFAREHLALRTYRLLDLPAARSHFAKVYINGEYMGVYLNVEQIDDEFCDTRFGSEEGNLFKCQWGSSLESVPQIFDHDIFELETNQEINNRFKLRDFVNLLNHPNSDTFNRKIDDWIDVDKTLKFFAVECIIGHWDGYIFNKNNYYIYENPSNGLFEVIPYDVDNTFGIDWVGIDWGERNLLDWKGHSDPRPLFDRLLQIPGKSDMFKNHLKNILDNTFTPKKYEAYFSEVFDLIKDAVKEDSYYSKTFGFDYEDFVNSYTTDVVKHAPYGLSEYMEKRWNQAYADLGISGLHKLSDKPLMAYPNPTSGSFYTSVIPGKIRVINAMGKVVDVKFETNGTETKVTFDPSLPNGLYFIYSESSQAARITLIRH